MGELLSCPTRPSSGRARKPAAGGQRYASVEMKPEYIALIVAVLVVGYVPGTTD